MAQVSVVYEAAFSHLTRRSDEIVSLASPTLAQLVESLATRYGPQFRSLLLDPATGELRGGIAVLVNGSRAALKDGLKDGDEVAFLVPFAGGEAL